MSTNYTLGQLIFRIIQYNEAQTRRPEDNSIHFWKIFVNEFYAENAIYKYGMLVSSVGGGKHFEPFVLPSRLLPRYYKALYQDNMRACSCILDNPQEYSPAPNTYILECSSARIVSVFDEAQICTYGSLKVTFSVNMKIENWVFDAHKHVEYLSYTSYEAKIASLMNNINAQMNSSPNTTNNNSNKMNHTNTNETNRVKTETDDSPIHMNGEKTNSNLNANTSTSTNTNTNTNCTNNTNSLHSINTNNTTTQPSFLDMECNGIHSPSNDLSLDTFLNNNDEDDETSDNTSSYTNNTESKTNNNTNSYTNHTESKTNNNTNKDTPNLDGSSNSCNSKSSHANNDGADVLNFVRAQLQNTFKYNSPVNEYGITPQVMRCFEISDIFLSMEELMDYCLQSGCSPKSAMSLWVNAHSVYET